MIKTSSSPIFVVGTGRSGSSIFHRMLCAHHEVAYLNRILRKDPTGLRMHRFYSRMLGIPGIGGVLESHGLKPDEAYPYWNQAFRGFENPVRDLTADDVTERTRKRFTEAVHAITAGSRRRPLIKITGWPRVGFLSTIFEDARFIHVVRDGRSVANSLLAVEFWEGWQGPGSWRFGPLSPEHWEEWLRYNKSFVILAGIGWKIMMDAMAEAQRMLPANRLLEVKYEDVCADPIPEFRRTAEFTGLKWSPEFERKLRSYPLRNQNEKWKSELTESQQKALTDVLRSHLELYGYVAPMQNPQSN